MSDEVLTRIKIWEEYREKINNESRRIENPFNDKSIAKILKDIKSINPSIIENLKTVDLKTPNLIKLKPVGENYYDYISFKIENLDYGTVSELDNELKIASSPRASIFALDENQLIKLESIDNSDSLEQLKQIHKAILNIENRVQHFPKDSKEYLYKLQNLVENINQKKFPPVEAIDLSKLVDNNKNKVIYFVLLGSFIFLMTIILVITLMIIFY